jgi:hypothetical protein
MRNTLFLLLILASVFTKAQTQLPMNADGRVEYTEVVQEDSLNAKALYSNAKLFIANGFKSAKDVTQLTDDNSNTLVAKGNIQTPIKSMGIYFDAHTNFKLTIQAKDNRYKYSITDFLFSYQPGTLTRTYEYGLEDNDHRGLSKKQWEQVKSYINERVLLMIAALEKQMSSRSSDW